MPKIQIAYCEQSHSDFSTDDVIEFYLEHNILPELRCADEECRQLIPSTRISPTCCNPEKPCLKALPHFRTYPKHQHRNHCRFGELSKQIKYVMEHKKAFKALAPERNLFKKLSGVADSSLIPDCYETIYAPNDMTLEIEAKAQEYIKKGCERDKAYYQAITQIPYKTSRLDTIIKICELLEISNERKDVLLSLPGRPSRNYENAFFEISFLKEQYKTPYIFYDYATIQRSTEGFVILYTKLIKNYREDLPEVQAMTFIPHEELRQFRFKRNILKQLNHFANSKETCCVYSFSAHCLKANTCPDPDLSRCVFIEPITLDALVIKKRCVKRSAKR